MFVPLSLGIPLVVVVALAMGWLALILAGRNPLPFPDAGSRIFTAVAPAAKATILELLAQHGQPSREKLAGLPSRSSLDASEAL